MILFIDFWLRWALWLWTVGLLFGATLRLLTPAAVVLAEHRLWTPLTAMEISENKQATHREKRSQLIVSVQ